jgi:hypothetical protein
MHTCHSSSGYGFQVEVNYHCHALGLHIVEVPILFADRTAGSSKMSSRIVFEAAQVVWDLRLAGRSAPTMPAPSSAAVPGLEPGSQRQPRQPKSTPTDHETWSLDRQPARETEEMASVVS